MEGETEKINNGGPDGGRCLPDIETAGGDNLPLELSASGMSLRDFFAGQALTGIMANINDFRFNDCKGGTVADGIANHCYFLADAMLKERGKKPKVS